MNGHRILLFFCAAGFSAAASAQTLQYPGVVTQATSAKAVNQQQSAQGTTSAPVTALPPIQQATQPVQPSSPNQAAAVESSFKQAPPLPDAQITESTLKGVPVFGQWLFQGNFARESFRGFNPEYLISVGDTIDLKLWGVVDFQAVLPVDAQGNIFVPRVGPVKVLNVRNAELNDVVKGRIRSVYREDMGVYATLAAAVPVKVFVSGYVNRPGLYPGFASDSLLNFIDRAGGINSLSGSYLDVRLMRNGETVRTVNLYDFLTKGAMTLVQLRDGDTLFVGPLGPTALVYGLVASPAQYEFTGETTMADLLKIAGVNGRATHVRVTRNSGIKRNSYYVALDDAQLQQAALAGDEIEVLADRLVGQIAVAVEGEHEGASQYVVPYNATLKDVLDQLQYSDQSKKESVQLFRKSVADRQKQVLEETLRKLEQAVLAARSKTVEEAGLRTKEAELVLQFVDRAKKIQPRGQVVLSKGYDPATITLEQGDVLRIPRNSSIVAVHGEVYYPNSFVWTKGKDILDYVEEAGGVIQKSADDRVLLLKPSGEIVSRPRAGLLYTTKVEPGDEIMVLPAVDSKNFQFGKDVIQAIYQIAVAAGVVARL